MQPIEEPKTMTELTVDRIREAIVTGELALGSKLSEQRLADTLGVSRSPARDALAKLQIEGLVNVFPKRGSFVFTPDQRHVVELCEHRSVLEAGAIRLAIARNREVLVRDLERINDAMKTALATGNFKKFSEGDMAFHRAIVRSCGNRTIIRTYENSISPIQALRTHLFTIMQAGADNASAEHETILASCREGDANKAAEQLEQHVGHLALSFSKAPLDSR